MQVNKNIIMLSFIFILCSCGKIKVETTPIKTEPVTFGPDFQKAAEFCDQRYGVGSVESEDCFQDYRRFLSPKIQFDLSSITSFCKDRYTVEGDIVGCEDDLLNIINQVNSGTKE